MDIDTDSELSAMNFTCEEQRLRGQGLKVDHQGLPCDLRFPPIQPRSPGDEPMNALKKGAQASQVTSANAMTLTTAANTKAVTAPLHEDEPPPDILTEQSPDGNPDMEKITREDHLDREKVHLDVQLNLRKRIAHSKPVENTKPQVIALEEAELISKPSAASPELPTLPLHDAPRETIQAPLCHEVRHQSVDEAAELACIKRAVAVKELRAEEKRAEIKVERRTHGNIPSAKEKDHEAAAYEGLLEALARLQGDHSLDRSHNQKFHNVLPMTPGWEENHHGSLLRTDAARAVVPHIDREPMNTENCGYYIGRRDPGPGTAPVEGRQVGFEPRQGAWIYLVDDQRERVVGHKVV